MHSYCYETLLGMIGLPLFPHSCDFFSGQHLILTSSSVMFMVVDSKGDTYMYMLLTSGECECTEVSEKVAGPLSFVLFEALASFLANACGQVWIGVGGEAFAGIRRCWSEQ